MRKEKRIENIAHFFHASPENTLAYHRVIGPTRHLGLNVISGFNEGKIDVESITKSEIVVIQRDFPRFYNDYERIISRARKENKPIVLDLDDLLFELQEEHPDRQGQTYANALLPSLQAVMEADMVTVATTPLKDYIQNYNRHVRVLPNFLDDALWNLQEPSTVLDQDQPITIGYMGGKSHEADLQLITPLLKKLVRTYPSKLQLMFWGISPPSELREMANVIHIPMQIHEYSKFVAGFQNETADIFIAPLVDNLFNSCKSAIKFLEYSARGVPGVYSNLPPYSGAIENGYEGYLATTPEEWLDSLSTLIENPQLRVEIASNAQETIRRKWLLSKNAHLWLEAYQETLGGKSPQRLDRPIFTTLKSITSQIGEFSTKREQQVQTLMAQVNEREEQVQALTAQVTEQEQQAQALTEQMDEREQQVQALTVQVDEQEHQVQALTAQVDEREQQVQTLTVQVDEGEQQVKALMAQVAEQELQMQALQERLDERIGQVQALIAQQREITVSKAWRVAMLLRRTRVSLLPPSSWRERLAKKLLSFLLFPFSGSRNINREKDLRLFRNSGYFDTEWYLAHNPDVAEAEIDPARHYLLTGAFEGRDPGPNFASKWYLETYPDVHAAGMNPLVHYLRFGQREGRFGKPDQLTDVAHDNGIIRSNFGDLVEQRSVRLRALKDRIFPFGTRRWRFYTGIRSLAAGIWENGLIRKRHRIKSDAVEASLHQKTYMAMLNTAFAYSDEYVPLSNKGVDGANSSVKAIAFYLPQFHPIPENDEWWGKGFTEWTNVSKAVPQFVGHYQPHLPGELGFYDLRIQEVQRRQVELAKKYGLFGFCFHYYWFAGKHLLETPLKEFMNDPHIDMPFCICWANENWTRRWDGRDDEILIAQMHDAESDIAFANDIIPILQHENYIRINGKPLLVVYRPQLLPDPKATADRWREYLSKRGLSEPYLVAAHVFEEINPQKIGFDAAVEFPPNTPVPLASFEDKVEILNPDYEGKIFSYAEIVEAMGSRPRPGYPLFKTVFPHWDREPRTPGRGATFAFSRPTLYRDWLERAFQFASKEPDPDKRFVFINAWNEWGEGAHLEPDRRYGYAYLQTTADVVSNYLPNQNDDVPGAWTILFVSHDANRGGAQAVLLNTLEWLHKHTFLKIKVLCLQGGEWLERFSELADTAVLGDLLQGSQTDDPQQVADAILRFYGERPDLIYGNTAVAGCAYPAFELIGSPILTHMHEMATSVEQYARDCVEALVTQTDHFIACSNAVRNYLVTDLGVSDEKISVVYSSIKTESPFKSLDKQEKRKARQAVGLDADKFIVLGSGIGMPFRKGADLFIDVARALQNKNSQDVHLYWVGAFANDEVDQNGVTWSEYLARIRKEGLQEHVTFLGLKDNVKEYMLAGDMFIVPSREDPFPLVALEAAECGLPVVCFDGAGSMPEFVAGDAGFMVPFEDTDAMAERVIQLIMDDGLRKKMGSRAREKLLSDFTFERTSPQILTICRKIARKKPAVSVVVPNYNHARYLPERLDSIFGQTIQDFEVILLDDASGDESIEILERYTEREGALLIKNRANSGSTFRQWLKGIDEANSEIVWIAESDDTCDSRFLEELLPAFRDEKVKLAYCNSHVIDEAGYIVGDYLNTEYLKTISETKWASDYCVSDEREINEALGIKNTILSASSALFRIPDIPSEMREQLHDMNIAGDWLMFILASNKGHICYLSDKLNHHRRHSESVIGRMLQENRLKSFFMEMQSVHEHVFSNYRLGTDFMNRWIEYVTNQWRDFRPGRPIEELEDYYQLREMKSRLEILTKTYVCYEPNGEPPRKSVRVLRDNTELGKYEDILKQIDLQIADVSAAQVPNLFSDIPLGVFGWLTLQMQDQYPNIRDFLPSMPAEETQLKWTGASGEILLEHSIAFVESAVQYARREFNLEDLSELKLLDFGCGWGRVLRLFYKYIPTTNLYAVDAWETVLQHCNICNIRANIAKIEEICTEIPFNVKFDLIISLSVFTHLSKRSAEAALLALRDSIDDNGLMIITVRPMEYIRYFLSRNNAVASTEDIEKLYKEDGFVFIPHNRKPFDGDITYGDTFVSVDYIEKNWREWRIVDSQINAIDPYQKLIVLKPR